MPTSAYRLSDELRGLAAEDAGRAALVHAGRTLTFAEVSDRADRVAVGLLAAGLVPGDRIGLLLPNGPEHAELLIGCARAGLVAVPLNWRLSPEELAGVVADAGARAFVVDPSTSALHEALGAAGDPLLVVTRGEEYESWLAAAPALAPPALSPDAERVVLQVYTSGTSGRPKGVLLTDANLAAKVPRVTPWWGVDRTSTTLLATPLFHVGGLSWVLVGLHARATTVIAADAQPTTLVSHLAHDGVTHTFLVPAMIQRLCAAAPDGLELPDLRAVMYGASPISEQTQRAAHDLFGPVLHQLYGLSETTGAFTEMPARADLDPGSPLWRSAGLPYPWVELEVRDPASGRRCGPGEFGEVRVRSEQNTPGYFGLPEETAELLPGDGWLRTGDGGHLDESGHLFLTERIKDLIISGGENVYPAEVEHALRRHADVLDAAAVGVPDERWGEAVEAVVVLRRESSTSADDLTRWAADRLAGYKRPRRIVVLGDLPSNATGKVLRHRVRAALDSIPDPAGGPR